MPPTKAAYAAAALPFSAEQNDPLLNWIEIQRDNGNLEAKANSMRPQDFLNSLDTLPRDRKLAALVATLTGPDGCAWDQKQTAHTIIDFVIDEAHELKQALQEGQQVEEELGDLLFTVEFLKARLAGEASLEQAVEGLVNKMIRRHPHVFAQVEFATEKDLKRNWELEKRKEKGGRQRYDQDLPASLAPMTRAAKVLARVTNAGFSYPGIEEAWDKVWEEFCELEAALGGEEEDFEAELGDLFLALLTVARIKGTSGPDALTGAVRRLCDRLETLEQRAGRQISEIPYEELSTRYCQAKDGPDPKSAFFNYCGVSPWPGPVRQAVSRASSLLANEGLAGTLRLREERESLRTLLRKFIDAEPDAAVVFVPNVSSAALAVAYAQTWTKGDKVLLGRGEFPANTIPWRQAAQTFGVEVVWFEDDLFRSKPEEAWNNLDAQLKLARPRLLAVSAVSFWSGFRFDLERLSELCSRYGTRLFVDAIQALGTSPVSMQGIDYLAGGSHKNLWSPEGAGFLVVGSRSRGDWQPRFASWLSLENPVDFLLQGVAHTIPNTGQARTGDPTVLEGGSLSGLGYAGLTRAVEMLSEPAVGECFPQILSRQDPLEKELVRRGWTSLRAPEKKHRSALLSFAPPPGTDLVQLQQSLAKQGVSVSIPNGHLRFGFHRTTKPAEVDYALEVLSSL